MTDHRPFEKPALDLSRHKFMKPYKDLVVFGTWLHNDDQEDDEPCLVIVPRYRAKGFTPAVVALSAAFKYTSHRYMARASRQFNAGLGFEDSMANWHKVADAIFDHLSDLLKMPPSPTQTIVVGEVGFTADGRRRTAQLLDFEPLQQA